MMTEEQYRAVVDRMDHLRMLVKQLRLELTRHRKPVEPPSGEARKQIFTLVAGFCSGPAGGASAAGEPVVMDVSIGEVAAVLWPGGAVKVTIWHRRAIGAALRTLGYQRYRTSAGGRRIRWRLPV